MPHLLESCGQQITSHHSPETSELALPEKIKITGIKDGDPVSRISGQCTLPCLLNRLSMLILVRQHHLLLLLQWIRLGDF